MRRKFRFVEELAIDDRYRIEVPERYRGIIRETEAKWVMVPVRDRKMSLDVMTESAFQALKEDKSKDAVTILGDPHPLVIDSHGRMTLPKEIRRYFPQNRARFVGTGDYFCIDPVNQ